MAKIETASVKVMRSHDYCHFEVCLGSSEANTPEAVDELRKTAARLADKAVEQYKIAKENAEKIGNDEYEKSYLIQRVKQISQLPEGERTIEEKATVKAYEDIQYSARRRRYDYEDD